MAYEFHYTPTGTGVISGKEVLEQTEDAINDLGNTAISGVQEALDKAEQALTNSENAVDDAQTALNTANNAEGVAIQAQNDVSNLSGTVTNIGNRVTTAEGNIGNLQGRMTTAEGNIGNLQGRMTTAEGNIGNLQTAVSTAQATANSAQQTATTARQQSYVFRYSSTALTPSSTNSNALLDNTDNLKVGDKVIDSDGVLFSITAIDTTNSTFTIGTALIDLAQDSDVVHKSGNEIVGGTKTFTDNNQIKTSSPKVLLVNTSQTGNTAPSSNTASFLRFDGETVNNFGGVQCEFLTTGENRLTNYVKDITIAKTNSIQQRANSATAITIFNTDSIVPTTDGVTALGSSSKRWSNIYGVNYYYGSNNVEFSTKFVTTDTNQTITGTKTFSSSINVYNSDSNTDTANIILKNSKAEVGAEFSEQSINFIDKNNNSLAKISCYGTVGTVTRLYITAFDTNNNSDGFYIRKSTTGAYILPTNASSVGIGNSTFPYYNVQTNRVNDLEPSSLSLPSGNLTDIIDISSYITYLDGTPNTYTTSVNGWISITMSNCSGIQAYINGFWGNQVVRPSAGTVRFLMPILKNQTANILVFGGAIDNARFIPCQGNV